MKYLFLLFPFFVFSQNMYNIEYLEKNKGGFYYKGQLFANEKESVYVKSATDTIIPKEIVNNDFIITDVIDEALQEEVTIALPLSSKPIVYFQKSQDYFNFTTKKIYEKGEIIIKDSLPNIKWKITDETKEILNFRCQKAIGQYKCREYVVWFSKDIPLSIGPWHLNGLPGAILEAKAADKHYEFTATKIKQVSNNSKEIKIKKNLFNKINQTIKYNEYLDKLDDYAISMSKEMVENMSKNKIEGGRITSASVITSFSTHDLCRENKKKQVKKHF